VNYKPGDALIFRAPCGRAASAAEELNCSPVIDTVEWERVF
jgi:hypothetical protein